MIDCEIIRGLLMVLDSALWTHSPLHFNGAAKLRPTWKNQFAARCLWHAKSHIMGKLGGVDEGGQGYLDKEVTQGRPLLTIPAWLRLFFLLVAFGIHNASAQSQWGVIFYTPYDTDAPISDIPWSFVTHVNHLGCEPLSSGALSCEANFSTRATALISAAHANNRKVLLTVGQLDGSADFSDAVTNNQSKLITNIMSTLTTYGYDGVDIDWETNWSGSSATTFFNALRTALGNLLLTADALDSNYGDFGTGHNLYTFLDRVNVMTYDITGNWANPEWFNSPLLRGSGDTNNGWSGDYIIMTLFHGAGVPLAKINLGIPFYGYTITGGSATNRPRATWSSSSPPTWSQITYANIVATYNISSPTWDTNCEVPWITVSGGYLTYENPESVAAKVQYVQTNSLGGWFAWTFEKDYIPGGNPTHPLLAAVNQAASPAPPTGLQSTVN